MNKGIVKPKKDLSVYVMILFYCSIIFLICLFLNDTLIRNFYYDDSFFYIKIAQNIKNGLGPTFDGINPTNGFHYLWMGFLVLLLPIDCNASTSLLRLVMIFHCILIAGTGLIFNRLLLIWEIRREWRLFAVFGFLCTSGFVNFGFETPVWLLFSWLFVFLFVKLLDDHNHRFLKLLIPFVTAAAVLSRSDAFIFILLISVSFFIYSFLVQNPLKANIRSLSIVVWTICIVVITIIGFCNHVYFGHPLNIASFLKTYFTGILGGEWLPKLQTFFILRMSVCFLFSLIGFILFLSRSKSELHDQDTKKPLIIYPMLLLLNAYVLVDTIRILCFVVDGIGSWQFSLDISILLINIACMGDLLTKSKLFIFDRSISKFLCVVLSLLIGYMTAGVLERRVTEDLWRKPFRLCKWINKNMGPHESALMVDCSGFTGYFSNRKIINGDGLVNSWEYSKMKNQGQLWKYIDDKKVDWIITTKRSYNGHCFLEIPDWRGGKYIAGTCPLNKATYYDGSHAMFHVKSFRRFH